MLFAAVAGLLACTPQPKDEITASGLKRSDFQAEVDGKKTDLYRLANASGMEVCVTNYGGRVVSVLAPGKGGAMYDVVLGFDSIADYLKHPSNYGATIGRYANRIAKGRFAIDNDTIQLELNDHGNTLHGGLRGWADRVFDAVQPDSSTLVLTYVSPDGESCFPGTVQAQVTYKLTDDNALDISYTATTDQKTIINLTNHSYFNLDGHGAGSIEEHELWLRASHFTPVAAGSIPTGEIRAVAGTPMDFTQPKKIGRDIREDYEQLLLTGGYDHNFVIDGWNDDGTLRHIATVKGPKSGRVLKAYTTLPGVQFYAGNFIDVQPGKDGVTYGNRCGFALETQYFPDTIHHENFPSYVFGGENGREYDSVTVYKFEA